MTYKREKYTQKKSRLAIPGNDFKKSSTVNVEQDASEDEESSIWDELDGVLPHTASSLKPLVYVIGLMGVIVGLFPETRSLFLIGLGVTLITLYHVALYLEYETDLSPETLEQISVAPWCDEARYALNSLSSILLGDKLTVKDLSFLLKIQKKHGNLDGQDTSSMLKSSV